MNDKLLTKFMNGGDVSSFYNTNSVSSASAGPGGRKRKKQQRQNKRRRNQQRRKRNRSDAMKRCTGNFMGGDC